MEEEALEDEEKDTVAQPPPSDDTRVENMEISDEGSGLADREWGESVGQGSGVSGCLFHVSTRGWGRSSIRVPRGAGGR